MSVAAIHANGKLCCADGSLMYEDEWTDDEYNGQSKPYFKDGILWKERNRGEEERMERTEFADGNTILLYYSGTQGEERMVRAEFTDGGILYFSGTQGEERMVRTECADGGIIYYSGMQGEERFVR